MSKLLDGIDPKEIHFLHLLSEQGHPAFSIAHRIAVENCLVGPDYIQFNNPFMEGSTMRVDRKRIVLVEYGEHVMPQLGADFFGSGGEDDEGPQFG